MNSMQWIPPTEEEREMFLDYALNQRRVFGDCNHFCSWSHRYFGIAESSYVAESLAMDGL